jgi:hypothetical protein
MKCDLFCRIIATRSSGSIQCRLTNPRREDLDPSLALVFFSNNNNFPEKKTFSCSAPHSSYFAEWEREWERRGPVGYIVSPLSLSCAPIRSRRRPTVLAPATTRRLLGSIGMPTALLLAMASPPISLRRLVVVCSGQILLGMDHLICRQVQVKNPVNFSTGLESFFPAAKLCEQLVRFAPSLSVVRVRSESFRF